MRTVGRIICLIVAIAAVAMGIPIFIEALNGLNASGWNDLAAYPEKVAYLSGFFTGIGYFLLALSALLATTTGHAGFIKLVIGLIVLGVAGWNIYSKISNGEVQGFWPIMQMIGNFAVPIGYGIGVAIIAFSPKK